MADDIVPELLSKINADFDGKTANSKILKEAMQILKSKKADFLNANAFGIEVGEILSGVLESSITPDVLPDGRMYYNIADRVLNSTLKKNFDLVSGYAVDVQSELNSLANIGIKAQVPTLNQDRIDGLVNRLASESSFDDVKWLLKDPIINFSQSVVDDTIDKNVDFQSKAGLSPKITRKVVGKACKWCQALAGSYDYPNVPHDIYRRHENCRCMVEYRPGDGRRQNVWSKKWTSQADSAMMEARKQIGLPLDDITVPGSLSAAANRIFVQKPISIANFGGDDAIRQGSTITGVKVIAGKGVKRNIDVVDNLLNEYPNSKKEDWQKVIGFAELDSGRRAEVHWYQAQNIGKVKFKIKRYLS